ncbi:MAG: methionine biosynthesis protein MetW [Actinobacteria bacterium]|nr:methionine biosynthesis protein MetW [Actinomycetota bacterium]
MKKLGIIKSWVEEGSKILFLGCGSGEIIKSLQSSNKIKGFGIDIDEIKVCDAISSGLSVIQGDINNDLTDYPKKSFDYVIAHDIIQIMTKPDVTIRQILELSNKVVISFPNFAYIRIRLGILFSGRMPKTRILPYEWYDTPNIHLFTIKDFRDFCQKEKIKIVDEHYTGFNKKSVPRFLLPNLFSEFSYFLLSK